MKCKDITLLRNNLDRLGWRAEEKPSGQIKHFLNDCVCNTYLTGTVVIQDNTKTKEYTKELGKLVKTLNNLSKAS